MSDRHEFSLYNGDVVWNNTDRKEPFGVPLYEPILCGVYIGNGQFNSDFESLDCFLSDYMFDVNDNDRPFVAGFTHVDDFVVWDAATTLGEST